MLRRFVYRHPLYTREAIGAQQRWREVSDVCEWRSRLGEAGARIEVLRADDRELAGRCDQIVNIEMFEAVGLTHYDDSFSAVDRLPVPDGVMFLQTITVDCQWFPQYHGTPDWIEMYIFPGGELASVGEMLASVARTTSLSLYHAENCGTHYPPTLRAWRARFHHNLARVRALFNEPWSEPDTRPRTQADCESAA